MITIEGTTVTAKSPEGREASIPLADFIKKARPRTIDSGDYVLPDGVKIIRSRGLSTIMVHESSPAIYNFKWIAEDSPVPYGRGATYRNVTIALPYMITMAVFLRDANGLHLAQNNECFFRTEPITSLTNKLMFPALLNVSKFPHKNQPLTWICTQHLNYDKLHSSKQPLRDSFSALRQCVIGTGFNLSSEHHEGQSWYNESKSIDKRIKTIATWEEATIKDPLFVLDVPWLDTNHTIKQATDRIFKQMGIEDEDKVTASTLARHIFNYEKSTAQAVATKD